MDTADEVLDRDVHRRGNLLDGLVVDRAGDVIDADDDALEEVPETVSVTIKNFVRGVHKVDGALLLVLDPDRALSVASS